MTAAGAAGCATSRWVTAAALAALLVLAAALPAAAGERGSVVREGVIDRDVWAAGSSVLVSGEVSGDVWAAGGAVRVERLVAGDVSAAAGTVEVEGNVTGDIRAVAGTVLCSGRVGGDLQAAAGRVRILPGTLVEGKALLAAGAVDVEGEVGALTTAAERVTISGVVRGDVEASAARVELLPGARVEGNLVYRSATPPVIGDGATVAGRLIRREVDLSQVARRAAGAFLITALVFLTGPLVIGMLLILLLPRFSLSAARTVGTDFPASIILGLLLVLALPAAALLLFFTIIGIPLALSLLAAYPLLLLVGFLTGVLFLGDRLRRLLGGTGEGGRGALLLSFLAALFLASVLAMVPRLGGLFLFVLVAAGSGAWNLRAWRGLRGGGNRTPAPGAPAASPPPQVPGAGEGALPPPPPPAVQ